MSSQLEVTPQKVEETHTCEKVYCANCFNCKITPVKAEKDDELYLFRVRCTKKMWKKRMGDPKLQKFFTVARRTMDSCPFYDPMGDTSEYIKELRNSLPIKDELYERSNDGFTVTSKTSLD